MKVLRGLPSSWHAMDCALAIGNFDGVHRGHQALLQHVVTAANLRGLQPAVLTFEPHPRELFASDNVPVRISTLRDKVEKMIELGIERVYVLPFSPEFANKTPEQFVTDILDDGLRCHWVTVGDNFRFGHHGAGDFETLKVLCKARNIEAVCTPLLFHKEDRISSTRIRQALASGDFYDVAEMLGHRFQMTGRVIHGAALGRSLGFPTLNTRILPPGALSTPALHGVYAVRVFGLDPTGVGRPGVASVGYKPTVSTDRKWLLETHIFDWKGDAYGRMIKTEFVAKIRDEQKFPSLEALTHQIEEDAKIARRLMGIGA